MIPPADRPDVRLHLRIPDTLEAFELSDWVADDRSDHAIPFLVPARLLGSLPWSHGTRILSAEPLWPGPLCRPGFVPNILGGQVPMCYKTCLPFA